MLAIYESAKADLGYNATLFARMLSEHGGVETARRLIRTSQPSDGFTTLWEHHRLDLTVEAHVIRPEYAELFAADEIESARARLESYGWRS